MYWDWVTGARVSDGADEGDRLLVMAIAPAEPITIVPARRPAASTFRRKLSASAAVGKWTLMACPSVSSPSS
jgi:hypothetical protein